MQDEVRPAGGVPIMVPERSRSVNLLYGFLTVVWIFVLWRGHGGAETDAGRLTLDIVFGLLLTGTVAAWIFMRRHPARLEISSDAIRLTHRGRKGFQELPRESGDLYIHYSGGKHPQAYLATPGAESKLPLLTFDLKEVSRAATVTGWRFRDGRSLT